MIPRWDGYLADPFILRTAGGYYAFGTDGPEDRAYAETSRYFPVLFSHDLVSWEFLGGALEDASQAAHWAPEVLEREGRYFLFYSSGGDEGEGHAIQFAVSARPEGPYVVEGVTLLPDEPFSIDANPFLDPVSGRAYLFFSKDFFDGRVGTGIAGVELGPDLRPIGEPVGLLRASADWQIYKRNRLWYGRLWKAWHTVEGSSVTFHEGRYWMFYSGGLWKGEDYGVGCAVADHPLGPYLEPKSGPVVLSGAKTGLLGPGHCSILAGTDGALRIVFHAWSTGFGRRQMYIESLQWTEAGPRVGRDMS